MAGGVKKEILKTGAVLVALPFIVAGFVWEVVRRSFIVGRGLCNQFYDWL